MGPNIKQLVRNIDEKFYSYFRRHSSKETNKVEQLRKNGYVIFDHLVGSDVIDRAVQKLELDISNFRFRKPLLSQTKIDREKHSNLIKSNFLMKRSELETHGLDAKFQVNDTLTSFVHRERPTTLEMEMPDDNDFYSIWLDPLILDVISSYFGFHPVMSEAFIRRNYPSDYVIMNHGWHRDSNHPTQLLKAFIFLNDCDEQNGPHHYVAGTHNTMEFTGQTYATDADIADYIEREKLQEVISIVPKGTIILEDTRGLHKAGIPLSRHRDLGFATFMPDRFVMKRKPDYRVGYSTSKKLTPYQRKYLIN